MMVGSVEVTDGEMTTHGLIQQRPDCIGEIRLTVVNDVVRHFPAHCGKTYSRVKASR